MGVSATLLRDRIGYSARSTTPDGQGGYTATYGSATYVRGRWATRKLGEEKLGDQLTGRQQIEVVLDPRGITPKEGDRIITRDGRTWDIIDSNKGNTPGSSMATADIAIILAVEVVV